MFSRLRRYSDRWWFLPLNALLAGADYFVAVIPTDGLLISCTLLKPKHWIRNAAAFTVGSTVGGIALAAVTTYYGNDFVHRWMPALSEGSFWKTTESWISSYGAWALFGLAVSPLAIIPAVVLCGLAKLPLLHVAVALLTGRIFKYFSLAWVTVYAPHWLGRLTGGR